MVKGSRGGDQVVRHSNLDPTLSISGLMSFNDLERGVAPGQQNRAAQSPQDAQFQTLQNALAMQVFKINANVKSIQKFVDQLGTNRDTGKLRKDLHDITDVTRDLVKKATDDLKQLASLQSNNPRQQAQFRKTSHDLQLSMASFQKAQKASAERQRTVVEAVKHAGEDGNDAAKTPGDGPSTSPSQQQMQLQINQLSAQELAYQEGLVAEREAQIIEIERGVHELNEIFRDVGTMVTNQGQMIDDIASNIANVESDTREADRELVTAADYQRKAGRRAACLMIIIIVVVTIVLIAILN